MKRLKTILKFAAIAIILLLSAIATLYVFFGRDIERPEDDDLRLARRTVPPGENGFDDLDPGDEEIYFPDEARALIEIFTSETAALLGEPVEVDARKATTGNGEALEEWDEKIAREILEKNAPLLDRLEMCLRRRDFLTPRPRNPFQDRHLLMLMKWRNLADLLQLRAMVLLGEGRKDEALRMSLKIIRFGRMIERSQGPLVTGLVGSVIQRMGFGLLEELLARGEPDSRALRDLLAGLRGLEPDPRTAREILQCEYEFFNYVIDHYQELPGDELPRVFRFGYSLVFRKERTRKMVVEAYRVVMQNASLPYAKWKPVPLPEDNLFNIGGTTMCKLALPAFSQSLKNLVLRSAFIHRTHRALVALLCHRLERGSLPESLESLVPGYLEAVPADPYDGKPLRYSREKKIIYSVGEDLVDDGGSLAEEGTTPLEDNYEPTLRIRLLDGN